MGKSFSTEKAARFLWGLVLLTLPVTSFRYFPLLGKHTYVRPLAFYPLFALYLIFIIRLWRKEIKFVPSGSLLPLLLFLLFALFASAAGALQAPLPLRGQSYWGRVLRAFLTLGIGLAFFLAAIQMHRSMDDLRVSLRWLYAGLFLTFLWVGVQAIALHTPLLSKAQVSTWQEVFSMRGLTKVRRVSGFAFEASWLAGQIATLYLPWLFASLLVHFRLTKNAWLEPLWLVGALAVLFLSFSRGGLLIAFLAAGVTVLVSGKKAIGRGIRWFLPPRDPQLETRQKAKALAQRILLALLILGITFGGISFLSHQKYLTRLWTVDADNLAEYFLKINAGGRFAYLWAETKIFLAHPFWGTGLGGSGFRLYDQLPDWALTNNPEVTKQLVQTSRIFPNSKNLYLRLLAETGIIGFSIFMAFLLGILAQIGDFLRDPQRKLAGVAGLFSFVAIVSYYLMQDSFAMPELWINFGIVVGLAMGKSGKTVGSGQSSVDQRPVDQLTS